MILALTALVGLVGVLQIDFVGVAVQTHNSALIQSGGVFHDDELSVGDIRDSLKVSEGHGKGLTIYSFGPTGNFSLVRASLVGGNINLDGILIQGKSSGKGIVEDVLIGVIAAHIGHGADELEGNCVAHVVVSYIVVLITVAAVLIVLVVFQNLLLHGGSISFDRNVDVANDLQQGSVVSTTSRHILGGILNQVVAISKAVCSRSQCGAVASLVGKSQFCNSVSQSGIGVVFAQHLGHICGSCTTAKFAAIHAFQGSQEGLTINAVAPLYVGQNAAAFVAFKDLVGGEAMVLQNAFGRDCYSRRKRRSSQCEDHDQCQQEAGEFSHVFHYLHSFLSLLSVYEVCAAAHQEDAVPSFLRLFWMYNRIPAAAVSSAPPAVYSCVPAPPVSGMT